MVLECCSAELLREAVLRFGALISRTSLSVDRLMDASQLEVRRWRSKQAHTAAILEEDGKLVVIQYVLDHLARIGQRAQVHRSNLSHHATMMRYNKIDVDGVGGVLDLVRQE